MMIKKGYFALFIVLVLSFSFISASLDIQKTAISTMAIKDLNKPAIFDLKITNNGDADTFSIYSLAGVYITPNESFSIASGETKDITINIYPTYPLRISPDYYSFEYKIKGQSSITQTDDISIMVVNLKDAFDFYVDPINPDSTTAKVHFDNKGGHVLSNINLELTSEFFSATQSISLAANEKKSFDINLEKDKMAELFAGPYIVNAKINIDNLETSTSTVLNFEEKPGINTTDTKEGRILQREEIEKTNIGNTKTTANIVVTKNLISSLFTSISIPETRKEINGFKRSYIFEKDLAPGESLKVVVKTNWWILIGIILALLIIYYLTDKYIKTKLVMKKTVSFVRTRGGEFALKVSLRIKARDFVEKIRITDRLPPMVKIFDQHTLSSPDKIDEANRRLEWNIQALSRGEERTFSYIIYSKIGVVGKFELPEAGAMYEYEGKIKETTSNKAFFVNQTDK